MGSFEVGCGISKIPILEGQKCVFAVLNDNHFVDESFIVMPVIYGTYNDYGRLLIDKKDRRNDSAKVIIDKFFKKKSIEEFINHIIDNFNFCYIDDKVWNYLCEGFELSDLNLSDLSKQKESYLDYLKYHVNFYYNDKDLEYRYDISYYEKCLEKTISKNDKAEISYCEKQIKLKTSNVYKIIWETCDNFKSYVTELSKLQYVQGKLYETYYKIDKTRMTSQTCLYDKFYKLTNKFAEIAKEHGDSQKLNAN